MDLVTVTDNWLQTQEEIQRRIAAIETELIEQRWILSQEVPASASQAKRKDENFNLQEQEQEALLEIEPLPVSVLQDLDRESCLRQLEDELANIKVLYKELISRNEYEGHADRANSESEMKQHQEKKLFRALSIQLDDGGAFQDGDGDDEQKNQNWLCKLSPLLQILVSCALVGAMIILILIFKTRSEVTMD